MFIAVPRQNPAAEIILGLREIDKKWTSGARSIVPIRIRLLPLGQIRYRQSPGYASACSAIHHARLGPETFDL